MTDFLPKYRVWLILQSILGLLLLGLCSLSDGFPSLIIAAFWATTGVASLAWLGGGVRTPADGVTVVRALALAVVLFVGSLVPRLSLGLSMAWGAVLLLDLVDGWCARRWGGSPQGAVYDMESDQMAVLGLALVSTKMAGVFAAVLLMPAMKYINVLMLELSGISPTEPKPRHGNNRRGRIVCALTIFILWVNTLPFAPVAVKSGLSGAGLLALFWSFADDFVFQLRIRSSPGRAGQTS